MKKVELPNYKLIYMDIISKKYPEKKDRCMYILKKNNLSEFDVLKLNAIIFGTDSEDSRIHNQKYKSYSKNTILGILRYQKNNNMNNSETANHFKLSRNTVTKWKKIFIV
ncbi:transposase [Chryseobacterium sp. BLS98]|uniref:hypothetical protein n=1 Tax=Chryseobacterium sp. BLS98 TaxID=885586 RepID=UPI00065AE94B|nr:hypothetical protein [Chryseobacterium sp. BLS98]KMQ63508.1 transposase [Chryseobacterium sp. BLS98]